LQVIASNHHHCMGGSIARKKVAIRTKTKRVHQQLALPCKSTLKLQPESKEWLTRSKPAETLDKLDTGQKQYDTPDMFKFQIF